MNDPRPAPPQKPEPVTRRRVGTRAAAGALYAGLLCLGLGAGCSSTAPRRDPTGELLPRAVGTALTGEERTLPDWFGGAPVVLLVGYLQDSQFDIDRWLMGLLTFETPVKVAEIPTIPGLAPTLFSGMIDEGMRRGIPRDDWGGVITLYGDDAERIAQALGNEKPLPARVLLLDSTGRVVWFYDQGFSPTVLRTLDREVRDLTGTDH